MNPAAPRVLFLTSGKRCQASRFRVGQFLPSLAAAGFETRVLACVPERSFTALRSSRLLLPLRLLRHAAMLPSRAAGAALAASYDVVFVQRDLWWGVSPLLEIVIARRNPNFVFDFDDAIWLYSPGRRREPIARIVAAARTVIAGNSFLAEYAGRYNRRVEVIPTCIDIDRFRPRAGDRRPGAVRLGWTGSSSTLPDLHRLAPVLAAFAADHPAARLLVIADRPPQAPLGIPVDFVRWTAENEVSALAEVDIGLMPLPDTEWSRGKCACKLLQYMACGIPAVASPVGVNREVVARDGDGGFLADSPGEWREALGELARDGGLRARVGAAGRALVSERYSVQRWAPRLAAILREPPGARLRPRREPRS